jgi:hypothetical protein
MREGKRWKIRTASPLARHSPRIFFLTAMEAYQLIVIAGLVNNEKWSILVMLLELT